jgi:hypothetical protein
VLPTNVDYKGAIVAIHRLEDTYLLSTSDIRNGNLSVKYHSRPLTAFECFELGRIAYETEDFYHTIRWMNEALRQYELEGASSTASKLDILDYLSYANAQVFVLEIYVWFEFTCFLKIHSFEFGNLKARKPQHCLRVDQRSVETK